MAKSNSIRVGAIENSGPNTLISYLRNAGSAASQIDIAVAFVTTAGLDSVIHLLKRTSAHGQVRFLTGLYQGFTEPKALRILLREQQQMDGRFLVKLSADPHFHWKSYFLLGKTTAQVVVGSSNMTDDGLRQTGEFNAVLSMRKASSQFHELHRVFEKHWQSKSRPLMADVLEKYEAWRASAEIVTHNRNVPLSKILASTRQKRRAETKREACFWRTCIDGRLSDEAEAMLKETTDWERRGYSYFSTGRTGFSVGDLAVLFDLNDRTVAVIEIKETTRTPKPTPDGYHFAAYRRVRGIPARKLVPKRWNSLKSAGGFHRKSDVYSIRKISAVKFEAFVDSLKEPVK